VVALAALAFATAAMAAAPSAPVTITGLASFGRAVPYGKSRMLVLHAHVGEVRHGVAMLDATGSLDPSFGDGGVVDVEAEDAAVDPDGKILIVSTTSDETEAGTGSEARVTRLLADGAVDPSFGHEGHVDISFGRWGYGETIAVAPNGEILVGGTRQDDPFNAYFTAADLAIARLKPDGAPDRTFWHQGVKIIKVGDEIGAMAIAPTPSGGVIVEEGNENVAYLEKLSRDGSFDRHFADGGYLSIEGRRGKSGARQLLLAHSGFVELSNGKLLVGATGLLRSGGFQSLVGRIDVDGRMDHSWGRDGWAVVPNGGAASEKTMAPLPGGGIAIATSFKVGKSRDDFGAVALDRNGRLDRKFGTAGSCRAAFASTGRAVDALGVGGQVIVLGAEGEISRLLSCPSAE
jgi:uncharacterized delta-60 repeat protein